MSESEEDALEIAERLEALASELQGGGVGSAAASAGPRTPTNGGDEEEESVQDHYTKEVLRDLTKDAIWSVSSAKAGNGVDALLDGTLNTYWQSDGMQPHTITASFRARRTVKCVMLYLNYSTDESYTPSVVSVRAGTNEHDLRLVRAPYELQNPEGWERIELSYWVRDDSDSSGDEMDDEALRALNARRAWRREQALTDVRAQMLQIVIHSNHQNGRDTHVRAVRVYGPMRQVATKRPNFTTAEMRNYSDWRP